VPTAGILTTLALVNTLPGSSVTWDEIQFHRFDIWGQFLSGAGTATGDQEPVDEALPIMVTLNQLTASGLSSDIPTFYSDGVGTARRSHVGIMPNDLYRHSWIPSNSTSPLLTVSTPPYFQGTGTPPYQMSVLVQFTCVVRSVVGSTQPAVPAVLTTRLLKQKFDALAICEEPMDEP